MSVLDDLVQRVAQLPPEQQAAVYRDAADATADSLWVPNPGPQTDAYFSEAEILLYGGQAGGGKTHLELGWGINNADSGIIFRRERTRTDGLEKEGRRIIGERASFNGSDLEWAWPNGKTLKLGGMNGPDDWNGYAGRERDYMAFDEGGEFLEMQIASILAWLRAAPGKRCRAVIGSNPPRTSDGLWMLKWFAPWLDDKFHEPAKPGELRWAFHVTANDELTVHWVDGPGEYEVDGEQYTAKSFTFIPASLSDNPYRNDPGYRARLQSLPEPLRSQLLYGKFSAGMKDAANQCIPTDWVRAAQARWVDRPPAGVPMCAIGVDCTGGGKDNMVLAPRYDGWFARLKKIPAKMIPAENKGAHEAGLVLAERHHQATVVVDMGGGYGGPLYEHLHSNEIEAVSYKGAEKSTRRTADGKLGFTNKRSAAYWKVREALDPGQPGGSPMAIPPDPRLLAGLTAPTFEVTPHGIQVEPKEKYNAQGKLSGGVKFKLGFSPDEADAVVMSWYEGPRYATNAQDWIAARDNGGFGKAKRPQVISSGRQPLSARRR